MTQNSMRMKAFDRVVPPPDPRIEAPLRTALARSAQRRFSRLLARWRPLARSRTASLRHLARAALTGPPPAAAEFLAGPDFRTWLASAEDAVALALAARAASTARKRAGTAAARGEEGTPAPWIRLMEVAFASGELARLAPKQTLPADFPARCMTRAVERLDTLADEFPLVAVPFLPAGARGTWVVPWTEEVAEGRPAGELRMTGARFLRRKRTSRGLRIEVRGAALRVSDSGRPDRGEWMPRPLLSPRGVPVASPVLSCARSLTVLPRDPGFASRVEVALSLLQRAWPAAAALVLSRTRIVVPMVEPGMVSFSSARRPGASWINIRSRPAVRLAEDLLHEAVHMRLHDLEEVAPLVRSRQGAGRDGEEPVFYSPWRREWRPLRGILHACCTFVAGALLFEALLAASEGASPCVRLPEARRDWLARRLAEELGDVAHGLRSLGVARESGLLAPAGARLARAVATQRRCLLPAARRRRRILATSARGRAELRCLREHEADVAGRTVRWRWTVPDDEQ